MWSWAPKFNRENKSSLKKPGKQIFPEKTGNIDIPWKKGIKYLLFLVAVVDSVSSNPEDAFPYPGVPDVLQALDGVIN